MLNFHIFPQNKQESRVYFVPFLFFLFWAQTTFCLPRHGTVSTYPLPTISLLLLETSAAPSAPLLASHAVARSHRGAARLHESACNRTPWLLNEKRKRRDKMVNPHAIRHLWFPSEKNKNTGKYGESECDKTSLVFKRA